MRIENSEQAQKEIADRMEDMGVSSYRLAKDLGHERANMRRTLKADMQLSTFLSIIHKLGGKVTITWKNPTP